MEQASVVVCILTGCGAHTPEPCLRLTQPSARSVKRDWQDVWRFSPHCSSKEMQQQQRGTAAREVITVTTADPVSPHCAGPVDRRRRLW